MSDGGLKVLDGTTLINDAVDFSLPDSEGSTIIGARVLELTESRVSQSLYGLKLPENLKLAALKRLNIDIADFRSKKLEKMQAIKVLRDYINAIADELTDDPLVVAVLDGSSLTMFLEDEDDFAMLAENIFTDLDIEDLGKLSKSEIRNALVHMGVEMGVPPFSEFPELDEILKKHEAEGEDKLGQAQFAQLLQPVLQDLADALANKNVIAVQNVKIINGSKLRKILLDVNQLNEVIEKMYKDKEADNQKGNKCNEVIRNYLEKNAKDLGLPPLGANESVTVLFDSVFAETGSGKNATEVERDEFSKVVKEILENFAQQLEANPVFHDFDSN